MSLAFLTSLFLCLFASAVLKIVNLPSVRCVFAVDVRLAVSWGAGSRNRVQCVGPHQALPSPGHCRGCGLTESRESCFPPSFPVIPCVCQELCDNPRDLNSCRPSLKGKKNLLYCSLTHVVPLSVLLSWWHEFRPALQCLLHFPTESWFQLWESRPWMSPSWAGYDWFEIKSLAVRVGEPLQEVRRDSQELLVVPGPGCLASARSGWTLRGLRCVSWGIELSPCSAGVLEPAQSPGSFACKVVLCALSLPTSLSVCSISFWAKLIKLIQVKYLTELMNEASPVKNRVFLF